MSLVFTLKIEYIITSSQQAFTCPRSIMETAKQRVKSVQR